MKNPRDYEQILLSGRWFRAVTESFRGRLLDAAELKLMKPGERLFSRGDPPSGIFGIADGAIRITSTAEQGKEALLTLAEPPSWIGEIAVFDGLPRTHDAVSDGESIVLHVAEAPLQAILASEPSGWRELGLLAAGKLRLAFVALEDMALLPAPVRLARRLVMISDGYGEWLDRTRRVVAIKQEQLAMMLSLSRQTTNQLLKDLESKGVLKLTYGEIEIVDADALRKIAQAS